MRFNRSGVVQLQRPEWQIEPMATQIRHGSVTEIPPAIPFGAGEVDAVEWPFGGGAEPQIPMHPVRDRMRFLRSFLNHNNVFVLFRFFFAALPSPGPRYPYMGFAYRPNGSRLNQLDNAPIVVAWTILRKQSAAPAPKRSRSRLTVNG